MIPLLSAVLLLLLSTSAHAQEAAAAAPSLLEQLVPGLVELALGLVALVALAVRVGAPALIKAHTDKGLMQTALLFVADTASAVVTAGEQTVGAHLRAAYADGKITRAELDAGLKELGEAAKRATYEATIGRLLSAGFSEADAKTAINARVEAAVPSAKSAVQASRAVQPARP